MIIADSGARPIAMAIMHVIYANNGPAIKTDAGAKHWRCGHRPHTWSTACRNTWRGLCETRTSLGPQAAEGAYALTPKQPPKRDLEQKHLHHENHEQSTPKHDPTVPPIYAKPAQGHSDS